MIATVIYTNETNLPILELFLKYFFKHNPDFAYPIYVVSNNFTKLDLPYQDKVTYLSGNVEWHSQGGHFSQTLSNVLPQIKEEYIFYFCEDYILTDTIDTNALENLIRLMQDENIDMFSFDSPFRSIDYEKWTPLNIDYSKYNFEPDKFYLTNLQYQNAYSVQPCIWRKSSLQQLLIDNPEASLHDMDNSKLNNKDNYKLVCTTYKIADQCCPSEYFIFRYVEIIRHSVFWIGPNGYSNMDYTWGSYFIKQLIKENQLHLKPEYDKYMLFDKSLVETW